MLEQFRGNKNDQILFIDPNTVNMIGKRETETKKTDVKLISSMGFPFYHSNSLFIPKHIFRINVAFLYLFIYYKFSMYLRSHKKHGTGKRSENDCPIQP